MIGAAAALLSFALLPMLVPGEKRLAAQDAEEIVRDRVLVDKGYHDDARPRLRLFLATRVGSPLAGEAHYLLAKSILDAASRGEFPGMPVLDEAWSRLVTARGLKHDPAAVLKLQVAIADFLYERGHPLDASLRYRELVAAGKDPTLLLRLAETLGAVARLDERERDRTLSESLGYVDLYLKVAPPEMRLPAFKARARIFWRLDRHREMAASLDAALQALPAERALLLERGKALSRLGREEEALAALAAAAAAPDPDPIKDEADFYRADLLIRAGRAEGEDLCDALVNRRDKEGAPGPMAPLAALVVGLQRLRTGRGDPMKGLLTGLRSLAGAHVIEAFRFDFAGFYEGLVLVLRKLEEDEGLVRSAELLQEIRRLFPREVRHTLELARLRKRAGELLEVRARKREQEEDRDAAKALRERAESHFWASAGLFEKAIDSGELDVPGLKHVMIEAAEACSSGRFHARAAVHFGRHYDIDTRENPASLFRQAESLMQSGAYESAQAGVRSALSAFAEYATRVPAGDPLVARALLHRSRMLAGLRRREEAVVECDRVWRDPSLGLDPQAEEWSEALLLRGRLLLELAEELRAKGPEDRRRQRLLEGREALREYLERYGTAPSPRPGSLEASYLLMRVDSTERDWRGALEHLRRMDRLAELLPASARVAHAEALRVSRFMEGELLYNVGEFADAARAFGEAYRRFAGSEDRLWGLVGRARAHLRLGRRDEARRDYTNGRAVFEGQRESFEKSLAGRGREWWGAELDSLAKELQ